MIHHLPKQISLETRSSFSFTHYIITFNVLPQFALFIHYPHLCFIIFIILYPWLSLCVYLTAFCCISLFAYPVAIFCDCSTINGCIYTFWIRRCCMILACRWWSVAVHLAQWSCAQHQVQRYLNNYHVTSIFRVHVRYPVETMGKEMTTIENMAVAKYRRM